MAKTELSFKTTNIGQFESCMDAAFIYFPEIRIYARVDLTVSSSIASFINKKQNVSAKCLK